MLDHRRGYEVPLAGGNAHRGRVVRVGDTVHRPRGDYSDAVHALLAHLAASGFSGAPRVLGADGRTEVLSYLDGTAANEPFPPWALTDQALVSVAKLLREYHGHARSFDPAGRSWQRPVPDAWRAGLVTHNDPHPANVIFRDGVAVGLIDFDLAAPGSVAWELAMAACFWAPLLDERDVEADRKGRALLRTRLLLDGYGASVQLRLAVVDAARAANTWIASIIEEASRAGHPAFGAVWEREAGKYARADQWIAAHQGALRAAVAGGHSR